MVLPELATADIYPKFEWKNIVWYVLLVKVHKTSTKEDTLYMRRDVWKLQTSTFRPTKETYHTLHRVCTQTATIPLVLGNVTDDISLEKSLI